MLENIETYIEDFVKLNVDDSSFVHQNILKSTKINLTNYRQNY